LILASGSVARKALLESLGVTVKVFETGCDETHDETDPARDTEMLAKRKLASFQDTHPLYEIPVLCCDTMISFQGSLIGKPKNRQEAFSQLSLFDGNMHEVHSGWALWYQEKVFSGTDLAEVSFKNLGPDRIASYLETEEWKGAAGSYRLQGAGRNLVEKIVGDEATVIGLPLLQISEILGAPLSV
jgi:septum formation protein